MRAVAPDMRAVAPAGTPSGAGANPHVRDQARSRTVPGAYPNRPFQSVAWSRGDGDRAGRAHRTASPGNRGTYQARPHP